jgi:hypothetical protein
MLDPRTEVLLREFFHGKSCCQCRRPAHRVARKCYYCEDHFPYRRPVPTIGRKVYKVSPWSQPS